MDLSPRRFRSDLGRDLALDYGEEPPRRGVAHVPGRLVVVSAAALWTCYYLLTTLRGVVVGLAYQDELAGRRLLVTFAGFVVTLMIWPLLRQLDGRRLWLRTGAALIVMLPAALLIATINSMVFADMEEKVVAKIGEAQGVRIRRDEAGNVLVDMPDMPSLPAVPAPIEIERPDGTRVVVEGPTSPPPPGTAPALPEGVVTIDQKVHAEAKWRQITDIALGRYFLLLAWAALYLALGYAETARAAERREGEYRRAAKSAELRSLRYQVNPHFLFNTLNSLSALVLTGKTPGGGDDDPDDLDLLSPQPGRRSDRRRAAGRGNPPPASLSRDRGGAVPRAVADRVSRSPRNSRLACVPGMILQPLVENSVKYAVAGLSRPVTVTLAAREEHGRLVLTISDDGPGASSSVGATGTGCGIGLQNVRDRLAARFGTEASVVSGADRRRLCDDHPLATDPPGLLTMSEETPAPRCAP